MIVKNLISNLIFLNRITKQFIMVFVDSILIVCVLLTSFSIRFGYLYWPKEVEILLAIFGSPLIAIPVFFGFKMYRSVVRFIGTDAMLSIFFAVTMYSIIWGLIDEMFSLQIVPRSIIIINWMFCLIVIGGSRLFARWLFSDKSIQNNNKKNIIIYGAGLAGIELSNSLKLSNKYNHVAYVDDNDKLSETIVNGVYVFNPSQIQSLANKHNIKNIFIALPSISRKHRKKIIEQLTPLSIEILNLPSISKLAEGKVTFNDLREINIKDLLGRETVEPNIELLRTKISNKVVLVTGAGGSIGSELSRQIVKYKPKHLILFEISESALYQIQEEILNLKSNNCQISPIIGSILDYRRMINIFENFNVQTVYHAAAYKHVPLVEFNQTQGVLNNSLGTMMLAKAAIKSSVETFVLISTDKAVRPTNTMGASKRVAELVLQGLAKQRHNTTLTMVRFGNVLDSSGSVIPLFRKQIKEGGPVTVTDKNIVRYFMTIPEAVELVIQAGAMGKGGDVFVLDMGQPIRINDLAKKMIRLSGLEVIDKNNPDGDINIVYSGLRPGEKLYEELLVGNNVTKTENQLIFRAKEEMISWEVLEPILENLRAASEDSDDFKVRDLLKKIVPEFNPNYPIEN
jgi:FlaA1/EpsC-like NDP-sugar epimerase